MLGRACAPCRSPESRRRHLRLGGLVAGRGNRLLAGLGFLGHLAELGFQQPQLLHQAAEVVLVRYLAAPAARALDPLQEPRRFQIGDVPLDLALAEAEPIGEVGLLRKRLALRTRLLQLSLAGQQG